MDTMEYGGDEGPDEGSDERPRMGAGPSESRCHDAILKTLVGICAHASPSETLVTDALERIVDALGLGGATFSIVEEIEGTLHLESVASAGSHAVFARELSARPLASLADAASAVADGRAVFSAEENGPVGPPGTAAGVGRWRSEVKAHATAILPVRAWGEVLGVLTVEWPCTGAIDEADREALEAIADVVGVLHHKSKAYSRGPEVPHAAAPAVTRAVLGITEQGMVIALGDEPSVRSDVALGIALVARVDTRGTVPFWDAIGTDTDRAALALGVASAHGGFAHGLAETCAQALRLLFVQGVPVESALTHLAGNVRVAAPPGGSVSAAVCSLGLGSDAVSVTFSGAGDVSLVVASPDGRVWITGESGAELGGPSMEPSPIHHALLVRGDRAVLVCAAAATDRHGIEVAVREALERWDDDEDIAGGVLERVSDESGAGAVMVVGYGASAIG